MPDIEDGQPARAARPRRCHVTPPELLLLPPRCTLAAAKQAVTEAFAEMYRLAVGWKCDEAGCQQDDADGCVLLGARLPHGLVVTAVGSGLDSEPRFRHAGGVEDWAVLCCCGTQDDDGEKMIVCDGCGFWMHTRCNGVLDSEDQPEPQGFMCQGCRAGRAAEAGVVGMVGGKRGRQ
eukprot:gene6177-6415_t